MNYDASSSRLAEKRPSDEAEVNESNDGFTAIDLKHQQGFLLTERKRVRTTRFLYRQRLLCRNSFA